MTEHEILGLIAERLEGAARVREAYFEGERLIVIAEDGAVYRIEALGEGYVEEEEDGDDEEDEADAPTD